MRLVEVPPETCPILMIWEGGRHVTCHILMIWGEVQEICLILLTWGEEDRPEIWGEDIPIIMIE